VTTATGADPKVLSTAEIETYRRDGFVKPAYRLPEPKLREIQQLAEQLIADNPHIVGIPFSSMHVPSYSVQPLKADGQRWRDVACLPDLVDIIEDLIGPDIAMFGMNLFHKARDTGGGVNWHRDAYHYPIDPLVTPNMWIALTPSTVENGCVKFVPGSHLTQERGAHISSADDESDPSVMVALKIDEEVDESQAVAVELEPGEMYLSDVFVIHGSTPNRTPIHRTGLSIRYYPTTSVYEHPKDGAESHSGATYTAFGSRPLVMVRGVDRSGRNDFHLGHPEGSNGLLGGRS
jgi:hypothetical protein